MLPQYNVPYTLQVRYDGSSDFFHLYDCRKGNVITRDEYCALARLRQSHLTYMMPLERYKTFGDYNTAKSKAWAELRDAIHYIGGTEETRAAVKLACDNTPLFRVQIAIENHDLPELLLLRRAATKLLMFWQKHGY